MAQGQGLESLIPKKGNQNNENNQQNLNNNSGSFSDANSNPNQSQNNQGYQPQQQTQKPPQPEPQPQEQGNQPAPFRFDANEYQKEQQTQQPQPQEPNQESQQPPQPQQQTQPEQSQSTPEPQPSFNNQNQEQRVQQQPTPETIPESTTQEPQSNPQTEPQIQSEPEPKPEPQNNIPVESSLTNQEESTPTTAPKQTEEEKKPQEAIFQIEVEKIKPNPYQPRKEYDEQGLDELAQSIREVGIIQPLVVSKIEEDTENGTKVHYQLISGERRLRASKKVGMKTVPAVVRREGDNNSKLSMALIENIQRSDLNPIETARAYAKLQDEFSLTQREIATRVGKSRESISNTLRLLNLPTEIQEAISKGKINESQGRVLLSVKDHAKQDKLFQKALNGDISTRRLRSMARKDDSQKSSVSRTKSEHSTQRENYWAKQIEDKLGIPVSIKEKGDEKRLTFRLFNNDEWEKLMGRLLNE